MSREIKELNFIEGLNLTAPDQRFISAGGVIPFASISDYITAKGTGAEVGDQFFNTTTFLIDTYANGTWVESVHPATPQLFTNKTIDGDDNIIRDLALSSLKVDASATNVFLQRNASGSVINTKAVPSGVVVGNSDSQTLTNKIIDGDDNTIQDLSLGTIKIDASATNVFLQRNGTGSVINTKAVPAGAVVGTSDSQILTNKTIDGDDNTIQDLAIASFKVDATHTAVFLQRDNSGNVINTKAVPIGAVVGTSDAQVLTGKTIDGDDNTIQDLAIGVFKVDATHTAVFLQRNASGAVINTLAVPNGAVLGGDDPLQIKQQSSISNATATYNKLYPKSDDKWYSKNSAGIEVQVGSGGAGDAATISLITPVDMVDASTTYIDLQGNNSAFDGGGTITASSLSISTTAAELLFNTKVIKYKPAANGQNDYFGFTRNMPLAVRGNLIGVSFWYKTDATTNANDFRSCIKIKDGALAGTIQYDNLPASSTKGTKWGVTFQVPSDCTQIEFGIQNTDTTTTLEFEWDQILLSSDAFITTNVANITAWTAYTMTIGGTTTAPTKATTKTVDYAQWRRVGENMEISYEYGHTNNTGTNAGSGLYYFPIPSGYLIDTTKVPLTGGFAVKGSGGGYHSTLGNASGFAAVRNNSSLFITLGDATVTPSILGSSFKAIDGTEVHYSFIVTVPIQGWTANDVNVVTPATTGVESYYLSQLGSNLTNLTGLIQFNFAAAMTLTKNGTALTYADFQLQNSNLIYVDNSVDPTKFYAAKNLQISLSVLTPAVTSNYISSIIALNGVTISSGTASPISSADAATSASFYMKKGDYFSVGSSGAIGNGGAYTMLSFTAINYQSAFLAAIPTEQVAYLKDVKANSTDGGTNSAGVWNTRILNTVEGDSSIVVLSSNQFTLQPGTYMIEASAEVYNVGAHRIAIYNITSSTFSIQGINGFIHNTYPSTNIAKLDGQLILTNPATFELRHFTLSSQASAGFGSWINASGTNEYYAIVRIIKMVR